MLKLNLQFFAEGSAPAGTEGAISAPDVSASAENEKGNGLVTELSDSETNEAVQSDSTAEKKPFSQLIKSDYKDEFTEEVNKIFSKRYKKEKSYEARYDNLKEAFVPLMERYEVSTPEELLEKLTGDEKALRSEAMERGMELEDYKKLLKLQTENRKKSEYIERLERERTEAERIKAHNALLSKWETEAMETKKEFPEFVLRDEVKNETFMNALRIGVSVSDAYKIAHPDIYKRLVAETERKSVLEAVRNKNARPKELGVSAHQPAREISDIASLPDKEIEEIRNRVMKGEKSSFS